MVWIYFWKPINLFTRKKQIDLLSSEFDAIGNWISEKRNTSVIIFTQNHKKSYLDKLELKNFNEMELIAFNKDFSEDESPELAKAEMEGIKFIRESLMELKNEKEVVILNVG